MEKDREEIQDLELMKIEPFTMVSDLLSNLWVIILGAAATAMLAYVVMNVRYVPQYSTSATFVVASKGDSNALSNLSSANEMAQMFERIIQSSAMRKKMSEVLDIDLQDAQITTEVLEGTNLLVLKVTENTPREAIDLIRGIMENYSSVSYYTMGDAVMDVLEEPKVPLVADNPLNNRDIVKKGFACGGLLLIVLFGIMSYLKDTVKQEDEIEQKLDARNLGVIAYESKYKTLHDILRREKKALLVNDPVAGFGFVEGYKKLATRVEYQMAKEKRQVIVVTSVSENEGKSTVAANLAITLAEQSKKVMLIDGDLRRASQFLIFGVKPEPENELGEFLKGEGKLNDIVMKSGIPGLGLIIGRNCYSSSTEILNSDRMERLLDVCRKTVDYVIVDSPPAGVAGDSEILAGYADAVMLVVKQNYMLAEDVNDILDAFREQKSKVLGVVLNGVRSLSSVPIGGGYGKYGKYGKYGNYAKSRRND